LKPFHHIAWVGRLSAFRNAYLLRGLGVWVGVRVAVAYGGVTDPGLATEIAILGLVALTVWLDARRRSEDLFLGNLGVPSWTIAALAVPAAAIAELLVP